MEDLDDLDDLLADALKENESNKSTRSPEKQISKPVASSSSAAPKQSNDFLASLFGDSTAKSTSSGLEDILSQGAWRQAEQQKGALSAPQETKSAVGVDQASPIAQQKSTSVADRVKDSGFSYGFSSGITSKRDEPLFADEVVMATTSAPSTVAMATAAAPSVVAMATSVANRGTSFQQGITSVATSRQQRAVTFAPDVITDNTREMSAPAALSKKASTTAQNSVMSTPLVTVQQQQKHDSKKLLELENELKLAIKQHSEERDALREEIEDLKTTIRSISRDKKDLEERIDRLKREHVENIEELETKAKKRMNDALDDAKEQHKRALAALEEELERLRQTHRRTDEDFAERSAGHRQTIDRLERQHRDEIAQLRDTHNMAVVKLREDYEAQLDRMETLKRQEIESLMKTLEQGRSIQHITDQVDKQSTELRSLHRTLDDTLHSTLAQRKHDLDVREKQLTVLEQRTRLENEQCREEVRQARQLVDFLQRMGEENARKYEEERYRLKEEIGRLKAERDTKDARVEARAQELDQQRMALDRTKTQLIAEQEAFLQQVAKMSVFITDGGATNTHRFQDGASFADVEMRRAQLEARERQYRDEVRDLNAKRDELRRITANANDVWNECQRKEKFLKQWENDLFEREARFMAERSALQAVGTLSKPDRRPTSDTSVGGFRAETLSALTQALSIWKTPQRSEEFDNLRMDAMSRLRAPKD